MKNEKFKNVCLTKGATIFMILAVQICYIHIVHPIMTRIKLGIVSNLCIDNCESGGGVKHYLILDK